MNIKRIVLATGVTLALAFRLAGPAVAAPPADLVEKLRQGGFVLVLRHATSATAAPDKTTAAPGNVNLERQLDETGRAEAAQYGSELKRLALPIRRVASSTGFRAIETAKLAGFAQPQLLKFLADPMSQGATGMTTPDDAARLRALAAEMPARGTDTLIVTHIPNVMAAFPDDSKDFQAAETLVLQPGKDGLKVVGRVRISEWSGFAGPAKGK